MTEQIELERGLNLAGENPSLADALRSHIVEDGFPCVGAKSALATGRLKVLPARSLTSAWNDIEIHEALLEWSEDYQLKVGLIDSIDHDGQAAGYALAAIVIR